MKERGLFLYQNEIDNAKNTKKRAIICIKTIESVR